jgi:hypothetical protein
MGEYVIRNRDDLIEVLRSRKDELGLSNGFIEHQLQMGDGACNKILGPTQSKGMSILVLLDMIELFGLSLSLRTDAAAEARMQARYERRDAVKVRRQRRLSERLMGIARKQFYEELSACGNAARRAKVSAKARSRIARAAATCRWKHRASEGVQA